MRLFIRKLNIYFLRLKDVLIPPFYVKQQRYDAVYQIRIVNKSSLAQPLTVCAPLPPTTLNQKIKAAIKFFPRDYIISQDKIFHNQYVVWQSLLKPAEEKIFSYAFTAAVAPCKYSLTSCYKIGDYRLNNSEKIFLTPNRFIEANGSQIKELAEKINGQEIDLASAIKKFNRYVLKKLAYGNKITGLYSALSALKNYQVDCGGYSSLLAALLIAAGIPARLVSGFWAGYDNNEMHAWLEILLPDGSWLPADPSTEQLAQAGRTRKLGRLGHVGSDRIIMSYGCDIPLEINGNTIKTDILQNPLVFSKLGKDEISVELEFITKRSEK